MKWLEKHKDTFNKLKKEKKQVTSDIRIIYNEILCAKCKRLIFVRAKAKKTMSMRLYCANCQREIKERFGDQYDS